MMKSNDYHKNIENCGILERGYNKLKKKMKRSLKEDEAWQEKKRKDVQ